ncbi:MAG: WD40 repeat domain-containing protein, partial [bacterium]
FGGRDRICFLDPKGAPLDTIECHSAVNELDFNPSSGQVALAMRDGTVRIWDDDGTQPHFLRLSDGLLRAVDWHPDGNHLAVAGVDRAIRVRDLGSGSQIVLSGHQGDILALDWSPDGKLLASGSYDRTVRLWDEGGSLTRTLGGQHGSVQDVAWSPSGKMLASNGEHAMMLFSPDGKVQTNTEPTGHNDFAVAWAPDGQMIAASGWPHNFALMASDGRLVRKIRAPDGAAQGRLPQNSPLDWSPDGRWILTGGTDMCVHLWCPDGRPGSVMRQHRGALSSVAFSPDGRFIASAGGDSTLVLWDTKSNEAQWVGLLLDGEQFITLFPGVQEILGDPKTIEKELVYLVEQPDESVELLSPKRFASLSDGELPPNGRAAE